MTTLPEEAVKAAKDVLYYANPNDVERALTAALPFLPVQGAVKKLEDWQLDQILTGVKSQVNHNGWEEPYVRNRLRHELDRILSALEPSAARELALEEAARAAENAMLEYNLSECAGFADWAAFEAGQESGLVHAAAAIRALSSPDHADAGKVEGDGWLPIESAPKDGAVILVLLPRMMNLIVRARYNSVHGYWVTDCDNEGRISSPTFFHPGDMWHPMPAIPSAPSEGAK